MKSIQDPVETPDPHCPCGQPVCEQGEYCAECFDLYIDGPKFTPDLQAQLDAANARIQQLEKAIDALADDHERKAINYDELATKANNRGQVSQYNRASASAQAHFSFAHKVRQLLNAEPQS